MLWDKDFEDETIALKTEHDTNLNQNIEREAASIVKEDQELKKEELKVGCSLNISLCWWG